MEKLEQKTAPNFKWRDVPRSIWYFLGEDKKKWEMKGLGWFTRAIDSEGNLFGILQPTEWQAK